MVRLLGTFVVLASMTVMLQAQTTGAQFPRTADGKPDFSGTWQTGGISLQGTDANVVQPAAPAAAAPAGRGARGGPGGAPAGARGAGGARGGARGGAAGLPTQPPLQDWARDKSAAMKNIDDPTVHCFQPGVPRVIGMPMPFEIVQTPNKIVILYEAFRSYRIIPTDGKKPVGESLPSYNGDSVGHWEGDTLVVDVSNFNGQIWGPGNMKVTSTKYHVTERYTPAGDAINYEAIIEDPDVLTGPFVYRTTMRRPPETRVMEYECLENNINLEHIVQ